MPETLPPTTRKTELTLSEGPELLPEDARSAAVIECELAAIDRGVSSDTLIAYVWPTREEALDARRIAILAGALDRPLTPVMSESENRLMDGNR